MITKEEIFERYPFLLPNQTLNLIVGADIDAIMSAHIFLSRSPNSRIVGLYDFQNLYYNSKLTPQQIKDCLFLDLDIYHPQCKSVGHHLLRHNPKDKLEGLTNSLNLNELLERTIKHISQKYPFGTAHFLLWLYDITDYKTNFGYHLYATADSIWINCQRYRWNAKDWLELFPSLITEKIFNESVTKEFEENMALFYDWLETAGIGEGNIADHRRSHLKKLGGHQGGMNENEFPADYVVRMMELCGSALANHKPEEQVNMGNISVIAGTRQIVKWNNVGLYLDEFLEEKNVFSYALTDSKQINITTLEIK